MALDYYLKLDFAFKKKKIPTIDKYRANSIATNKCYPCVHVKV